MVDLKHALNYFRTMITANIHDAKTHLSEYLDRLDTEGEILLCKRNIPIARILPVKKGTGRLKRVLSGDGLAVVLDGRFREPLDPETEAAFAGK